MKIKLWSFLGIMGLYSILGSKMAFAADAAPGINIQVANSGDWTSSMQIFLVVTVLTLAPSFLIMFTCFPQIIMVFSLARQGLGVQGSVPPNQVLIGLALFLTLFTMQPVLTSVYQDAWKPYSDKQITFQEALQKAETPLKSFMFKNTSASNLELFLKINKDQKPKNPDDLNILTLTPAYSLSQIENGFIQGLKIYTLFLAIDFVVGVILMLFNMMMVPPQTMSLPLKILLFVKMGGYGTIVESLLHTIKI